jgi:hypothetical protein
VCRVPVEAAFYEVPFRVVQDAAEFELARLSERRVAAEEAKSSLQEELEAAAAARVAREQKIVAKAQAAHTKRIQQVPCAASCAFLALVSIALSRCRRRRLLRLRKLPRTPQGKPKRHSGCTASRLTGCPQPTVRCFAVVLFFYSPRGSCETSCLCEEQSNGELCRSLRRRSPRKNATSAWNPSYL